MFCAVLIALRLWSMMLLCTPSIFCEASITWDRQRGGRCYGFERLAGIALHSRSSFYLPVHWSILHQLFKPLLNHFLESTGLISLFPKLTSECSISRAQLQKHDKVRLWQSHVGFHAPVLTETLNRTKASAVAPQTHDILLDVEGTKINSPA